MSSLINGLRSQQHKFPNPILVLLQTRSIRTHRAIKPLVWKSTHSLVQSTPLLSLLDDRCTCISHLKQIQSQMTLTGLISDPFASSRLVAFCALSQSRDLGHCLRILLCSERTNAFSWNTAIRGYSESDTPIEAFLLYKEMMVRSKPDGFTYPLVLKVCADSESVSMGFQILGHVAKLGFETHVFVHNAAIHMLVSCGFLVAAREMFDESTVRDLVTWNSLINGYARAGLAREALRVYREMAVERVEPDEVTMIGLVSSCAKLEDLNKGREFRRVIDSSGLSLTVPLSNALMDMYVKCGDLESAQELFDTMMTKTAFSWATIIAGYSKASLFETARKLLDEMPEKNNAVPWNAMIGSYVQAKRGKDALALFQEMQSLDIEPDENTMIGCLSACSQLGALDVGTWIHHYMEKNIVSSSNVVLRTALVHMYAKCGNIEKALQVFSETPIRNSLTWTAIICGLAFHGHAREALSHFERMIDAGVDPDEVTFLGVLSACCHGGLVEEGRKYFSQMSSRFNLHPNRRHYSCLVDLLGRAGHLEEAEKVVESMTVEEADAAVWGALFFACRVHKNVAMGERAASKLFELDPGDSGNYVLLSSLYKEANMWDKAEKARRMMDKKGVVKTPGCSAIEVDGIVCEFTVRGDSHSHSKSIYECLSWLTREIEIVGSFPDEFLTEFR